MSECKGFRVSLPILKGRPESQQLFEIKGTYSGEPIASLAEAVNAPPFCSVYCTFREHDPQRLLVKVIPNEAATQNGTYGVNIMLEGATEFSPI